MPPATVPLFSRDFGGEGRPPLVILHGMLGSSRNWQTAGARLSEKHHVIALDLRNHGASPHAETMTYEAMAADVAAWLDGRGLGPVTLMGHSMGGKVAMLLACREPQRVGRLIVVDTAPRNYFWKENREIFSALGSLEVSALTSRAEADKKLQDRVPSWATRQFLLTNLDRDQTGRWNWLVNLPVLAAALSELEANPLGPADRFMGPVLVIAGGKSDYVQPGDWDKVAAHFPSASLRVIASAGHNPHIQAREEFVLSVLSTAEGTPEGSPQGPPAR